MKRATKRSEEELFNTFTHTVGVVFALVGAFFVIVPGCKTNWAMGFGTTVFVAGMLFMYICSTLYHWSVGNKRKRLWRIFDHASIYVMIAASYTPICLGIVSGVRGWALFGLQWVLAAVGVVFKIRYTGRYPRLSLITYLAMGWSIVFVAPSVFTRLPASALWAILGEGIAYTSGTYFFAHDGRRFFHGVWHISVLLGSVFHWFALLLILRS